MLKCSKEAFAACPTRHLCGCPEEAVFTEGSECDQFNRQIGSKPMTNADRIRAMSDEELAYWVMCPYDNPPCGGEPDGTVFNCMDCTLKWLQQPAEVSGDG